METDGPARTFYDDWLEAGDRIEKAFRTSPGVARDADAAWVRTRHDVRVKRLLSVDDGFPTMGGVVLKAEIPRGWHTGLHRHGEEAIYIETGHGFALIEGHRFDVKPGSVLHIPYRAAHQLVNLSDGDLRYVAASIAPLEQYVHLFKLEQLEDCAENTPELLATASAVGVALPGGRRIVIDLDESPTDPGDEPTAGMAAYTKQHFLVHYLTVARNGFKVPSSVAMTHVFEEPAGSHGGRHQHLEAVLYVIQGHGYSEVGGVRHPWGPGDILHVPPAMHEHEHSNPGDVAYRLLRIQFGIRYFFQEVWPEGYTPTRSVDAEGNPIQAGWLPGREPKGATAGH